MVDHIEYKEENKLTEQYIHLTKKAYYITIYGNIVQGIILGICFSWIFIK